jgi:hypothetical protein
MPSLCLLCVCVSAKPPLLHFFFELRKVGQEEKIVCVVWYVICLLAFRHCDL